MGDRKWKDLPIDCLVNIFSRIELEFLVDCVPLVCKSWHKGTQSHLCWQSLILPDNLPRWRYLECIPPSFLVTYNERRPKEILSLRAFVKFVIRRSRGTLNVVVFPDDLPLKEDVLKCIGEGCPLLKRLVLPCDIFDCKQMLPDMICKWKDLEALTITTPNLIEKIVPQISIHCKNFKSLSVMGVDISKTAASLIATLLPDIEFLSLRWSWIERGFLVIILKGCKKLVHLDVSHCLGFKVDDGILKLAAHIANVNFDGAGVL